MNESESLENDEKLLETMMEMQEEIEQKTRDLEEKDRKLSNQAQINSEQQGTISALSSQVSTLKNALEEKSQKIISLNEQISSSEKQRKELKEKCEKATNETKRSEEEADRIRRLFSQENDAMVKERDRQIRKMCTEINLGIVCLMLLLAYATPARLYVVQIGQDIMNYALWVFNKLLAWSGAIAAITEKIPYEILQISLYWGFRTIVVAGLVLFFYVLPVTLIVGIILRYAESCYYDKVNRWIIVVTMMVLILLISRFKVNVGINPLLLWGIIQCLVPVVRFVIPAIVRFTIRKWRKAEEQTKRNIRAGLIMAGGFMGISILVMVLI